MTGRGERVRVFPCPSASKAKQKKLYSLGADLLLQLQAVIPFGDITGTAEAAKVMSQ